MMLKKLFGLLSLTGSPWLPRRNYDFDKPGETAYCNSGTWLSSPAHHLIDPTP